MWICLNNAFLSIVEPGSLDRAQKGDVLMVRARRKGDIERVFGTSTVVEKRPERDYLFRAFIPRELVAIQVAAAVTSISYGNFKNSVKDDLLHKAYAAVWGIMARLQPTAPYSGGRVRTSRRQGALL